MEQTKKGAIALDFDGVINSYKSGFVAPDIIPDPPVPGVFDRIVEYIDAGFKVYLYSTRCGLPGGEKAMMEWLVDHGFPNDYIGRFQPVSGSKPRAKIYIDDRGYHFTGELPTVEFVENFTPWHGGKSSTQK